MKLSFLKPVFSLIVVCFALNGNAQTINIVANPGTSVTPAMGSSNYAANESIYTDAEIGTGNFLTAGLAITYVGFSLNTIGANTQFDSVSIYMKDVAATTTTFTSGNYSTAGYTLVFSGSITFSTTGFTEIALSTPFTRTVGSNLQVLITRTDNQTHPSFIWNCANGNNTSSTISTTRRYNGTTALSGSTNLAVSAFRQAIRFKHLYANDAGVNIIYTLTKLPIPNAAQQAISARVTNYGSDALTNLPVSLNISGANTYSQNQTITSLASGTTSSVTFPLTNFTDTGTNTVTVSVPADEYAINDSKSLSQFVNFNTWSYADNIPITLGIGFSGATGDFVTRFNTAAATFLTQVTVNFVGSGQPFKIGIWDASGAGNTPGTLLWESVQNTSTAGIFVMPVFPFVSLAAGDFFVGVKQTGTANLNFGYQAEEPIRSSTFYFTSPTGSTAWSDFSPGSPYRFVIEPKLILPEDASLGLLNINGGSSISCAGMAHSISTTISNTGANAIAPGAATVNLKIAGANNFTGAVSNTGSIASGSAEVVTFTDVIFNNPGINYDTAYIVFAGDLESANDTVKTSHQTQATSTSIPLMETYENLPYAFSNIKQLSGTGNWVIHTGNVTNAGLTAPLAPHSGGKLMLFDAYTFSAATSSRVYGNCVTIPVLGSSSCTHPYLGFWMSHDNSFPTASDSVYVIVSTDNGATWSPVAGYMRYNSLYTTPAWSKETLDLSAYAGQTIMIGFNAISKFGNVIAIDDIMIGSQALQNVSLSDTISNSVNLQLTCDDAGWSYYANPLLPNENILAINWDPGNTNANAAAKAAALPTITVDAAIYAAENTNEQRATYTMRRYWNVEIGNDMLNAPVNIRFFYDSLEVNQVNNAVANFVTANGGTAATPTWFKTISGGYTPSPTQVTTNGVMNTIPLADVNTMKERINGISYAQFNGITSFSGGTYAGGVGENTPLPITGIDISANAAGKKNRIKWTTKEATSTDYFWLEKSNDGKQFINIQKVPSQKLNIQSPYVAYDETPEIGTNYYRVKLMEHSGNDYYSEVVSVTNTGSAQLSVFPNPAKGIVHVSLFSNGNNVALITLTDISGRIMDQIYSEITKGANVIGLPIKGYASGHYLLKVNMGTETYQAKVMVD